MKGPCIAYSADLSPKESIIYKMPIAILNDEQELELVAVAKMGLGKNHAKYLPGLLYYRYAGEKQGKDDDNSFNELVETVKKDANKELLVNIESWGQIPVKKIFPEAVDALNKEIKALIKEVK